MVIGEDSEWRCSRSDLLKRPLSCTRRVGTAVSFRLSVLQPLVNMSTRVRRCLHVAIYVSVSLSRAYQRRAVRCSSQSRDRREPDRGLSLAKPPPYLNLNPLSRVQCRCTTEVHLYLRLALACHHLRTYRRGPCRNPHSLSTLRAGQLLLWLCLARAT